MTWTDRVGNAIKGVAVLFIDIATIGTELLKQAATALDQFADNLKEQLS